MEDNKKKGQQKDFDKETINRRKFFVALGNTAIGIATLGSFGVSLDFLFPKVSLEIPRRFMIGTLVTMQSNSVIFDPEHRLFIFRDKLGYFFALSTVCTHLGCNVEWKATGVPGYPEGVMMCPCHGSLFNKTGDVISGPAPRSLDRYKMYLEDDKLIVDMEEIVGEEEMILKV